MSKETYIYDDQARGRYGVFETCLVLADSIMHLQILSVGVGVKKIVILLWMS